MPVWAGWSWWEETCLPHLMGAALPDTLSPPGSQRVPDCCADSKSEAGEVKETNCDSQVDLYAGQGGNNWTKGLPRMGDILWGRATVCD